MDDKKYNALLWTNENKNNSNAPDFKGEMDIEGEKLQAAAWLKTARNNKKYIALTINNKVKKNTIEKLPKKNSTHKTSKNPSYIGSGGTKTPPKRYARRSIFANANESPQTSRNPSYIGSGGAKKPPKKYARFINEPLGTRSDFIKDKKRTGK